MRTTLLLVCLLLLVACQSTTTTVSKQSDAELNLTTEATLSGLVSASPADPDGEVALARFGDVELHVAVPDTWEAFQTDYGIILSEHAGSVATGGKLDGMLVYVFLPEVEEMLSSLTPPSDTNIAQALLSQIVQRPNYVGNAAVSSPTPFQWNEYDAAYYTLNSGDGNLTMLMVVAPTADTIVAYNISIPEESVARIRRLLPQVLTSVQVNDIRLDGQSLDTHLPTSLDFPSTDVEIASENTPER